MATRVKAYRDAHQLSQRAFGKIVGISQGKVSHIEMGVHPQSTALNERLEKLLGESRPPVDTNTENILPLVVRVQKIGITLLTIEQLQKLQLAHYRMLGLDLELTDDQIRKLVS